MNRSEDSPPGVASGSAAAAVPEDKYARDRALVEAILSGSEKAWHRFVLTYSGLIQAVLRKYLFDTDRLRSVYVGVLEGLYHRKLASYEGRASLSTWLVLVARNAALDQLRHDLGRRELPAGLQDLDPKDQEIYRLYYIEGLSFGAVRHWIAGPNLPPIPADQLAKALRRIDARLSSRVLRRIAYDLHAPSVGASSGRLLEFLEQHRIEQQRRSREQSPDHALLEREARELADEMRQCMSELDDNERLVLELRFDKGFTAAQIAETLGLSGTRRSYTLIEKAIRALRRRMGVARSPDDCPPR